MPFDDDIQAYFTAGIYDHETMIVVATWSGGSQQVLEAFLSTMSVWPESVPFEERVVREVPTCVAVLTTARLRRL